MHENQEVRLQVHTGEILKEARRAIGLSQLDLALSLDISQRHVSFVERARSRPSRDLIVKWMSAVEAPASISNAALFSAGYALLLDPGRSRPGDVEQATRVHHRVLDTHDPMPGLIFNADWRMLRLNRGARWLFGLIMPKFLLSLGAGADHAWDMIAGIAHPGGLLAHMPEPWIIGRRHLSQLRIEQLNRPALKPRIDGLEHVLRARYGDMLDAPQAASSEPGLDLQFDTAHGRLSFFTVQTVFNLPQDIVPTTVRTGLWYPADRATQDVLVYHVGAQAAPVADEDAA